jgi:hypothetical protein
MICKQLLFLLVYNSHFSLFRLKFLVYSKKQFLTIFSQRNRTNKKGYFSMQLFFKCILERVSEFYQKYKFQFFLVFLMKMLQKLRLFVLFGFIKVLILFFYIKIIFSYFIIDVVLVLFVQNMALNKGYSKLTFHFYDSHCISKLRK